MWDDKFMLPVPPVSAVAPTSFSYWCTLTYSLISIVALIFAFIYWRKSGKPILIVIIIAGGMTGFIEPLVDLLGACWHPRTGHAIAYELMGRPIPWWIVAVYFAYFGALGILNYIAFEKGVKMWQVKLWFVVPMLADVIVELIMLPTGLYIYYGQQPLVIFGWLPAWWVPCNSMGQFLGITSAVLMVKYLPRFNVLWLLIIFPIADVVGYALIAIPSWIVINTPSPNWLVQLGGVATFFLAFMVIHLVALIIGVDSPIRTQFQNQRDLKPLSPAI